MGFLVYSDFYFSHGFPKDLEKNNYAICFRGIFLCFREKYKYAFERSRTILPEEKIACFHKINIFAFRGGTNLLP